MRRLALSMLLLAACQTPEKTALPAPDYGDDGKADSLRAPASTVDVALGQVATASFSARSQYRAFRFDGKKGQKVTLYVDGLAGLDTVAYLYKANSRPTGRALASNDDTTVEGWTVRKNRTPNPYSSSIVDFVLPETRKYALVATTYWGESGKAEIVIEAAGGLTCSRLIACPGDQYCALPDGLCDGDDLPGACQPRPQICAKIYQPVCGCNGVTYGNDCEREAAGAQKAADGVCLKQLHNVAREHVFGSAENQYIYPSEADAYAANLSGRWLAFDGETAGALKFVSGSHDLWVQRFEVDRLSATLTITAEH
jgi:hypothetical protein